MADDDTRDGSSGDSGAAEPGDRPREIHHHHYHDRHEGGFSLVRLFLGLLIVLVGFAYLADMLGWTSISFHLDLWKLWPLIIIFAGLSLLPKTGWIAGTIRFLVVVAVLVIVGLFLLVFGTRDRQQNRMMDDVDIGVSGLEIKWK